MCLSNTTDKPNAELDEALRTYPWALFVTLTFPVDDPAIVKQARTNFLEWLRDQEISYFYGFELSHRPHYHMVWNKCATRDEIVVAWQKSLQRALQKKYVRRPEVDVQYITPGTADRVYGYILKDVSDPFQRQRIQELYDLPHVWGYGGKDFRNYYSYVRTILLRDRNASEEEFDAHYHRLKTIQLEWEEAITKRRTSSYDTLIGDQRGEALLAHFFGLGSGSFQQLFVRFVRKRTGEEPLSAGFRTYLKGVGFEAVLKCILVTACALVFLEQHTWSRPAFMHNLYFSLAHLNRPSYDRIVGILPDQYDNENTYTLALELFNHFQSSYADVFKVVNPTDSTILVTMSSTGGDLREKFGELFQKLLPSLTRYPMIVVPRHWKCEPANLSQNYTGGFLFNDKEFFVPLCSGNEEKNLILLPNATEHVDQVNAQQSCAYTINFKYLDVLATSKLWVTDEAFVEAEAYIDATRKRTDDSGSSKEVALSARQLKLTPEEFSHHRFVKAQEAVGAYQQQRLIYEVCKGMCEDLRQKLGSHYYQRFYIYFVRFLDFRGRTYVGHSLSFFVTKFRYALQDCVARPFSLSKFKECASKYYLGSKSKLTKTELIAYFDLHLDGPMRKFRTQAIIYENADEPEAFLGCCIEYERYCAFVSKYGKETDFDPALAYRSRWFASEDETASGAHHRSLFFGEGVNAVSLNMAGGGLDARPHDRYLDMFQRYRGEYLMESGQFETWERFGFADVNLYLPHFKLQSRLTAEPPSLNFCQIELFRPIFKKLFMAGDYNMSIHTYRNVVVNQFDEWKLFVGPENYEARAFIVRSTWEFYLIKSGNTVMNTLTKALFSVFRDEKIPFSYLTQMHGLVTVGTVQTRKVIIRRELSTAPTLQSSATLSLKALRQSKKPRRRVYLTVLCRKPHRPLDLLAIERSLSPDIIHSQDATVSGYFAIAMKRRYPYVSHFIIHDCFFVSSLYMDEATALLRQLVYDLYFGRLIPFREQFVRQVRFCLERELRLRHYGTDRVGHLLAKFDQIMDECLRKLDTMVVMPYDPKLLLDSRYFHY